MRYLVTIIALIILLIGCSSTEPAPEIIAPVSPTIPSTVVSGPSASGTIRPSVRPGLMNGTSISYLPSIHFDFDSFLLNSEAREILQSNADILRSQPTLRIRIEGHCDERGSADYNLALGDRRAIGAKQYLVDLGIAYSRIETVTFGEEIPFDERHNEEAWTKNRRAMFVVLP